MNPDSTQTTDRLSHAKTWSDKRKRTRPSVLIQRPSCIYLIRDGDCYKLGLADNPEGRLYDLQVGNPRQLELVRFWRVDRAPEVEERLHAVFDAYHVRGEWFKLPYAVVASLLNADGLEEFFAQP